LLTFVAAMILTPSSAFKTANVDWTLGVFLFPFFVAAGFLEKWLFYGKHDAGEVDPFYVRAWLGTISSAICLPLCWLFRPSFADLFFTAFSFNAGPVLAAYLYRRPKTAKAAG